MSPHWSHKRQVSPPAATHSLAATPPRALEVSGVRLLRLGCIQGAVFLVHLNCQEMDKT